MCKYCRRQPKKELKVTHEYVEQSLSSMEEDLKVKSEVGYFFLIISKIISFISSIHASLSITINVAYGFFLEFAW
jgi:hypothetical protein